MSRAAPLSRRYRSDEMTALRESLLIASPLALLTAGLAGLPWWIVAAAAVVELAILLRLVRRRDGLELLGPLYFYDLVRLARRGRTTLLRCLYVALLLGLLYVVYREYFPDYDLLTDPFHTQLVLTLAGEARFARDVSGSILMLQGAAVMVLAPAYLAGAIAEEKEQRTLDLLFTTHLRDHEIVLGKLFARLSHLAVLLLASLPILMFVEIFGGLNVTLVLAGFAASLISLLSVGSVSILCSVLCRRVLTAVLSSYAVCVSCSIVCLCLPWGYVSSPVAFVAALSSSPAMGGESLGPGSLWLRGRQRMSDDGENVLATLALYAAFHTAVSGYCCVLATYKLRAGGRHGGPDSPPRVVLPWDPVDVFTQRPLCEPLPAMTEPVRPPDVHVSPSPRDVNPPPVGDRPLLWKEMHHGLGTGMAALWEFLLLARCAALVGLAGITSIFLLSYVQAPVATAEFVRTSLDDVVRGAFVALAACWCICLALHAAVSVSGERDRRTLDSLFTLPLERETILQAKWLGSIVRYRALGCLLAAVWVLGLLTGTFNPLAAVLLAAAVAVHIAFLASLGVWLSLVCRNILWSNLTMALGLLLVFGAAPLLFPADAPSWMELSWQQRFYEVGLNPMRTWWALGRSWDVLGGLVEPYDHRLLITSAAALTGVAVFAVLAALFWLLARRRFRRELTRGR